MKEDVVLVLSFTSWSGALARGFCMPEDRLAAALVSSDRVGRLLVVNPFRSAPVAAARKLMGDRDAPFPAGPTRHLHEPRRLRRFDPASLRSIKRTCARYERSIHRAVRELGLRQPAVIATHPLVAGFGSFEWASKVTYYAWDDWRASIPHRRWWPAYDAAYARLRTSGRAVVAVSETLLERIDPAGGGYVLANGVDADEWKRTGNPPSWLAELPRPWLLYVGSLDDRVDVAQIHALAKELPAGSILLVGPTCDAAHVRRLAALERVHVPGPVDRKQLTGLVAAADVGLIPHVRTPMTEAMSPLKLYEYLAGGLPVATVDLPSVHGVSSRVVVAPSARDFPGAVARALKLGRASEPERLRFVAQHSWEERFRRLLDVSVGLTPADLVLGAQAQHAEPGRRVRPCCGRAGTPIVEALTVSASSHLPRTES